jgi:hypothetical protein
MVGSAEVILGKAGVITVVGLVLAFALGQAGFAVAALVCLVAAAAGAAIRVVAYLREGGGE